MRCIQVQCPKQDKLGYIVRVAFLPCEALLCQNEQVLTKINLVMACAMPLIDTLFWVSLRRSVWSEALNAEKVQLYVTKQ